MIKEPFVPDVCFKRNIDALGVSQTSLHLLNPGRWLNDEIINAFILMIKDAYEKDEKKRGEVTFMNTWASVTLQKLSLKGNMLKVDKLFKKVRPSASV